MNGKDAVRSVVMGAIVGMAIGVSWARLTSGGAERLGAGLAGDAALPEPVPSDDGQGLEHGTSSARPLSAIEPLSADVLRRRIVEVFPAGYLTIIAIIQGVALGAAIVTTQQQLLSHQGIAQRFNAVAQALVIVASIVVTTHAYLVLTMNVRWAPTILDTLVPYALGVGEVSASLLIGHTTAWWIAVSVLLGTGVGAFSYSFAREPQTAFSHNIRKSLAIRISFCCLLLAYSTAAAVMSAAGIGSAWIYVMMSCGLLLGAIVVGTIGARTQNRLYDAFGIPRWRGRL